MKKYSLFLTAILLIVISGCTKSGSGGGTSFTVAAIPNYTATENVDTSFAVPVAVTLTSGSSSSQLTLTPSGMPAGVTVIPASFTGVGTFTTAFAFTSDATVSGTFPITITAANSAGSKTYTFDLVIAAAGSGPTSSFTYSVAGLSSNITLPQYSDTTVSLPVSVTYGSGTAESVALSYSTPPSGITLTVTPNTGTPSYTSTVAVHVAINTVGTYPITITSSAAGTTPQVHTFNVITTAASNCVPEVTGTYSTLVSTCSNSLYNETESNVTVVANGVTNEVTISNPYGPLTGTLNCGASTLTTPTGAFGADFYYYGGHGTFTSNTIVINLPMNQTGPSDSFNCVLTYTR